MTDGNAPKLHRNVNIPAAPGMGAPPPDAPRETAQPLTAELLRQQAAIAKHNEDLVQQMLDSGHFTSQAAAVSAITRQRKENAEAGQPDAPVVVPPQRVGGSLYRPAAKLPPVNPQLAAAAREAVARRRAAARPGVTIPAASEPAAVPAATSMTPPAAIILTDAPPVQQDAPPVASGPADEPMPAQLVADLPDQTAAVQAQLDALVDDAALAVAIAEAEAAELASLADTHPAASNTDTPSRGIPRAIADPGKKITGGFGAVGQDQYYPLRGDEVRAAIEALAAQLLTRLKNDLRLSPALTYPRAQIRLDLTVQGYPLDNRFDIPVVAKPPKDQTPVELARQLADECVFVVVQEMVELPDDGSEGAPPNAVRAALGLEIPRRHQVGMGQAGKMLVDRS